MTENPEPDKTRVGAPRRRRIAVVAVLVVGLCGVALIGGGAWISGDPVQLPENDMREARSVDDAPEPRPTPAPTTERPSAEPSPDSGAEVEASHTVSPDPAWVTRIAAEAEIPERALAAYAGAVLTISAKMPTCGIGWNTLAAIGHVESQHGSIGGAVLHDDGRVTPRILGVPLDGTAFIAIPDTDGGRLDGDATWDRAVGPMQFIPSTWEIYGRDGNGDGTADPDQIDDAVLSAATLLCTEGGDLRVPENWITALDAYNPSVSYNNDVVDAADYYASVG